MNLSIRLCGTAYGYGYKRLTSVPKCLRPCWSSTASVVPESILVNNSRPDPIARHYRQMKLGKYNVNYVKVGHGPHAVFCYPGVLGAMRTHLKELIANFEKHSDTYTFYAWDQPGYGQSRPPARIFTDSSLQEDAELSHDLLKALGHEKYSIMGWSGGGLSALLFAEQFQYLVNKLIVWGVFAYVDKEDADQFAWFRVLKNWPGKMQDVLTEEYGEEFLKNQFEVWMDLFIRIHTHNNGEFCTRDLHKITCPTFILHGKLDSLVLPKHAHYLHSQIPGSKMLIMEKGKHNIQIRYHAEFFNAIHEFLQ